MLVMRTTLYYNNIIVYVYYYTIINTLPVHSNRRVSNG